jgi:hypothetical protein
MSEIPQILKKDDVLAVARLAE